MEPRKQFKKIKQNMLKVKRNEHKVIHRPSFFVHTVAFLRRLRIVLSHHSVATQSDTSEKTLKALVLIKENQETNKKLKSNNLCTLIDQKGIFHHLSLLPPLNVAAETGWRLCTVQIQACWVSFDSPPQSSF